MAVLGLFHPQQSIFAVEIEDVLFVRWLRRLFVLSVDWGSIRRWFGWGGSQHHRKRFLDWNLRTVALGYSLPELDFELNRAVPLRLADSGTHLRFGVADNPAAAPPFNGLRPDDGEGADLNGVLVGTAYKLADPSFYLSRIHSYLIQTLINIFIV